MVSLTIKPIFIIQYSYITISLCFKDEDTGASTSKAAAAAANNKHLKPEKEDQDDEDDLNSTSSTTETDLAKDLKSEGDSKDDPNTEDNKKSSSNNSKNDGNDTEDEDDDDEDLSQSEIEVSSLPSPLFDLDDEAKEELADLSMMLHSSAPFAPHHHHHPHAHHPHHARGAGVGAGQNYGGVNSAFHRQPSSGGFHHGHHQVRKICVIY